MKFEAVILQEINQPLVVDELEIVSLEVGQVLVEVLASGICGAQLQEIAGLKGNAKFVPHTLGHEGVGIVRDIGVGVTTLKAGDKVVMHWRAGKGIEAPFPKYKYGSRIISGGKVTTLAQYSVVSENRLTKVNDDEDNILCALMGCGITTAFGVINNEAKVKLGESVLVIGVGGVGMFLIKGAQLAGAAPIYSVDNADKERLAQEAGSNVFINIKKQEFPTNIYFDVILDTTGSNSVFSEYSQKLSNNGRYILVGQPKPNTELILPNAYHLFNGRGQIIKATQGGETSPNEDIGRYLSLYKNRRISPSFGVSHNEFKLGHINTAIDTMRQGLAGRIVITM